MQINIDTVEKAQTLIARLQRELGETFVANCALDIIATNQAATIIDITAHRDALVEANTNMHGRIVEIEGHQIEGRKYIATLEAQVRAHETVAKADLKETRKAARAQRKLDKELNPPLNTEGEYDEIDELLKPKRTRIGKRARDKFIQSVESALSPLTES